MDSVKDNKTLDFPFPVWTVDKKDFWEQEQLQSRVDEYNRLLNYCHELEKQICVLESDDSPSKHRQFNYQNNTISPIEFLDEYKTLIFLIINILFIVLICIFFYYHPEI